MSERTPEENARRHVRNATIEMWAWVIFTVPYMIWLKESVAVVGLLSVYALVITAKGVKRAGEAEIAGYVNPQMPEDSDVDE